jgi:hypothetical protein
MRLFAAFHVVLSMGGCCFASRPTVTITNGTVIGRSLPELDQDVFLSIPYADAPLRFNTSIGRTTKFDGAFDAG